MFKSLFSAAVLAIAGIGSAHADLATVSQWDTTYPNIAGVQFNTVTNADGFGSVSLGAHPYKSGVTMANDGVSTFYAPGGVYAADGLGRANWSFDWVVQLGANCLGCTARLMVDNDPSSNVNYVDLSAITTNGPESWNMEMGFMTALVYDFNPYAPSSTGFRLDLLSAAGAVLASSAITVNVPEPESLALVGVALAGLAVVRRRKAKQQA